MWLRLRNARVKPKCDIILVLSGDLQPIRQRHLVGDYMYIHVPSTPVMVLDYSSATTHRRDTKLGMCTWVGPSSDGSATPP